MRVRHLQGCIDRLHQSCYHRAGEVSECCLEQQNHRFLTALTRLETYARTSGSTVCAFWKGLSSSMVLKLTTSGIFPPLAEQILGVLSGLYSKKELRDVAVH